MGKRLLNLYVDDETIELAKAKRINMSQLVRNILSIENGLTQGSEIDNLKTANTKLITECQNLRAELEKAQKEIEEWKNKNKPKTYKLISRD